jgi:hypothetical protein
MSKTQEIEAAKGRPASDGRGGGWQRWTPYAVVVWSLVYAALGLYWAVSGRGFPYAPELMNGITDPVAGRFGSTVAWIVVIALGIPAAALGALMLRGVKRLRLLLISAGALLSAILLLFMYDVLLLSMLGYTPQGVFDLLTGSENGQFYLQLLTQYKWTLLHQLFCLIGGFFWLGATVSYARRSGDACLYCGRSDVQQGWNSPENAARWGRIAVYVSIVVPIFYGITRYAYALGIPLGISENYLRIGQESEMWTKGISMANFALVGAVLTLGLVQRWGEVFPRWMIGLAGKRVPIGLAVVPAAIVSVMLIVGGISMWSGYAEAVAESIAGSAEDIGFIGSAPTALFPLWGAALAVATLGYYLRRRGPCKVCGRGASCEQP